MLRVSHENCRRIYRYWCDCTSFHAIVSILFKWEHWIEYWNGLQEIHTTYSPILGIIAQSNGWSVEVVNVVVGDLKMSAFIILYIFSHSHGSLIRMDWSRRHGPIWGGNYMTPHSITIWHSMLVQSLHKRGGFGATYFVTKVNCWDQEKR